jgi:hypothetical protein
MKRTFLAVPALAVAATVVLTTAGSAQAPGERTFKLVEKGGASKFVDNPPKATRRRGPSAGDSFLFSANLYDAGGAKVGYVAVQCTIMPGPAHAQPNCVGTAKLKDGTITVAGLSGVSNTTIVSITGGTGAYEGARGSVTSVARSNANNAPADDTVHILG